MTTAHLLLVAGAILGAGSGLTLIACCHGTARSNQPPGPAQPDPVRQAAETSGLIPRPEGTS
ncbi:hypothetical protein ACIGZJ_30955 [Kitasatospora sp. NPDC052868]|uniref:hypothetical protein n=1 Tax=Kitasatospora sp. NPDC052868 TaxID=3364060 RepID=UPI0037CAF8F9